MNRAKNVKIFLCKASIIKACSFDRVRCDMDYREVIQESIDYIENNLKEKILLEDLAKIAFLSKFHYHRIFHGIIGKTVMDYIRKRRLTEAAKELVESDEKIINIALKYQFSCQESFTRAFKKMFDISPGEFRRRQVDILLYRKIETSYSKISSPSTISSICKAA